MREVWWFFAQPHFTIEPWLLVGKIGRLESSLTGYRGEGFPLSRQILILAKIKRGLSSHEREVTWKPVEQIRDWLHRTRLDPCAHPRLACRRSNQWRRVTFDREAVSPVTFVTIGLGASHSSERPGRVKKKEG